MFRMEVIEKKAYFISRTFFPKIVPFMRWFGGARQATDNNIVWRMRFACWITKATNILRICNTYCFSASTLVTRTRLTVRFMVHYRSFYSSVVYFTTPSLAGAM
jgi:hypothetical protein